MFVLFLVKTLIYCVQRYTVQDHVMQCYARPRRDEVVETKMIILSGFCLNTSSSGFAVYVEE